MLFGEIERDIAHRRDARGVFDRLVEMPQGFCHFLRAFQVNSRGIFQAAVVGDQPAHADAAENVVGVVVVFVQEMHIVGRDQSDAQLFRQFGQLRIHRRPARAHAFALR